MPLHGGPVQAIPRCRPDALVAVFTHAADTGKMISPEISVALHEGKEVGIRKQPVGSGRSEVFNHPAGSRRGKAEGHGLDDGVRLFAVLFPGRLDPALGRTGDAGGFRDPCRRGVQRT